MSIAVIPSMQSRARALKLQNPELDHNEIAQMIGARAADVRAALEVKDVTRKTRAMLHARTR